MLVVSNMANLLQKLSSFLGYWYFRYMLVTELYMVEKWERIFINIFFIVLFLSFFIFNYKVLLPIAEVVSSTSL
ncbi:uncharacterized protein LOC124949880 [Vespa velutina]|uniref:uncharacterized protein LOC124949880 n=1 Tax=Vespa velutina TaxID=202808 RepID=UPI001FB4FF9B|nr:uncharacterized protein LOC124949880 [Vespa velutina]